MGKVGLYDHGDSANLVLLELVLELVLEFNIKICSKCNITDSEGCIGKFILLLVFNLQSSFSQMNFPLA